jgi:hypothetical protein
MRYIQFGVEQSKRKGAGNTTNEQPTQPPIQQQSFNGPTVIRSNQDADLSSNIGEGSSMSNRPFISTQGMIQPDYDPYDPLIKLNTPYRSMFDPMRFSYHKYPAVSRTNALQGPFTTEGMIQPDYDPYDPNLQSSDLQIVQPQPNQISTGQPQPNQGTSMVDAMLAGNLFGGPSNTTTSNSKGKSKSKSKPDVKQNSMVENPGQGVPTSNAFNLGNISD